jgi:hypothetical protein
MAKKKSKKKKRTAPVSKGVRKAYRTIKKHLSKLDRLKEKQRAELAKTEAEIRELSSL